LCGCGSHSREPATSSQSLEALASAQRPEPADNTPARIDGLVRIDGERGIYVRCTGIGSPTLMLEGGDEDMSDLVKETDPDLVTEVILDVVRAA